MWHVWIIIDPESFMNWYKFFFLVIKSTCLMLFLEYV